MKEQFNAWWEGISARERLLTILSGLFILLAVIYWGAWQPLSNQLAKSQSDLQRAQQTLAWVQEKAPELANMGNAKSSGQRSSASLANIINSSARQYKVKFSRVINKKDKIEVWIAEIEFDLFVAWLASLDNKYSVNVVNADVSKTDKAGYVKVNRLLLAY